MTGLKKISNIFLALCMCFCIISFAVTVTLNFKQLYYIDAEKYNVGDYVGLSHEEVKENYDALINYNSLFSTVALEFPDLEMSYEGEYHFMEVRNIFVGMQILMLLSGLVLVTVGTIKISKKDYNFLALGGAFTVIIPLILGIFVSINWQWAFIKFHEIAFSNDYWIFDPVTDPVILILPNEFFMHCAFTIVAIALVLSLLSIVAYFKLRKAKGAKIEDTGV